MNLNSAIALFNSRLLPNRWFQAASIAVVVFAIYLATSKGSTAYDQYVRLADAFLHGRLYLLDAPDWLELARYGDKAYVINPPAPVLFLLPWVAIWGVSTNQVIVSMLIASGAVGLFWVAATQLRWGLHFKLAIVMLLAFGTNLWWAATEGSMWTLPHVSAVFFLMAALVETTGKNRPWLVGLLVGLAGLSRLPVFLVFPFYAYTVGLGSKDRRTMVRRLMVFGIALAALGVLYLLYNYGRYGTLAEQGYYHPQYASERWFADGRFDISYIPRHIDAILFQTPVFKDEFPYFKPSLMGLGVFYTTPALLYTFRMSWTGLTSAALAGIVLAGILLTMHGTTGWTQFGYRYSIDVLPLLVILVASGMHHSLDKLKISVILLCCFINLWGTLSFNKFDWAVF